MALLRRALAVLPRFLSAPTHKFAVPFLQASCRALYSTEPKQTKAEEDVVDEAEEDEDLADEEEEDHGEENEETDTLSERGEDEDPALDLDNINSDAADYVRGYESEFLKLPIILEGSELYVPSNEPPLLSEAVEAEEEPLTEDEEAESDTEESSDKKEPYTDPRQLAHSPGSRNAVDYQQLIEMGRHAKVLKGGRAYTITAFVVVANGNGAGGLGYGKGEKAPEALANARTDAIRNILCVDRLHDSTLPATVFMEKWNGTRVRVLNRGPGMGISASPFMEEICQAWGFKDLCVVFTGRKQKPINYLKAFWNALRRPEHITPEMFARRSGQRLLNMNKVYRATEQVYGTNNDPWGLVRKNLGFLPIPGTKPPQNPHGSGGDGRPNPTTPSTSA